VSQALARVREAAKRNRRERFTALMHHLTPDLLAWAFHQLKPKAAPGIDGVTWDEYAASLDANIGDLHRRVMRGGYRARPSRRQYIPKPTAGNGRSASRRWRTRSSNARSWRC
jgi:retron-type reverse transcriptase